MVNFMCQLDWNTGCLYGWLNIILGVSVRMFPKVLAFELVDWIKQIALSSVGGYLPPNLLRAWVEQRAEEG